MFTHNLPWIEKYKPSKLSDIYGNELLINRFKDIISNGNLSNMIISGNSGVGKTISVNCLCKELLGDYYNDAVLELNSSQDRGISAVRDKIKNFAQKKIVMNSGQYKIIILDEADNMTSGAQQALRRIIENYTKNTRFIFLCNEPSKIIEPIQSRCSIYRFESPNKDELYSILEKICNSEKITYNKKALHTIVLISNKDYRQAINNLQSIYYSKKNISYENVIEVCDVPQPELIKNIIDLCVTNQLNHAITFTIKIWNSGYSMTDILNTFLISIKEYDINDKLKLFFIKKIGIIYLRDSEGINSLNQLISLLTYLNELSIKFNL
tara:strand:- start:1998 stop:2969 length:972 start_codon:yes stop_codon:yes gene_type:complete